MKLWTREWCLWVLSFAIFSIAGCASPSSSPAPSDPTVPSWQGRIAIKVHSEPAQAWSADFSLQGSAGEGALTLTTAWGTTLARLDWGPQGASLYGQGDPQRFASVDELTERVVGTPLPMQGLFAWLEGRSQAIPGWTVDLQDLPQGRLTAQRYAPAPLADLKIVLER